MRQLGAISPGTLFEPAKRLDLVRDFVRVIAAALNVSRRRTRSRDYVFVEMNRSFGGPLLVRRGRRG